MSIQRKKKRTAKREPHWPCDHWTEEKLVVALLSAKTEDRATMSWAFEMLHENDFDYPAHHYVFIGMRAAFAAGANWTPAKVFRWILKSGSAENTEEILRFGGRLLKSPNHLWFPWHIEYYCKKLRDVRMTRARAIVGQKIYASALAADTADEFTRYVTEQMDLLAKVKPL